MKDMLEVLRKRLTIMGIFSTVLILIIITSVTYLVCCNEIKNKSKIDLLNNIDEIKYRLQVERNVTDWWLSEIEISNDLVISISNDQDDFLFKGSKPTFTPRKKIMDEVNNLLKLPISFLFLNP